MHLKNEVHFFILRRNVEYVIFNTAGDFITSRVCFGHFAHNYRLRDEKRRFHARADQHQRDKAGL